jgi:mycoketide-CoA synthase
LVAAGGVVFTFPGQGAQWAGMARRLWAADAVFASRMDECDRLLEWSLRDVVDGVLGAPSLDRVDVVQPVSFAVMVSLAETWRARGVTPRAVVGHSQGEVAGAVVAGKLTLAKGMRLVVARSRVIAAHLSGRGGAMLSVATGEQRAGELIDGRAVEIAAVNGPDSVVVSGTRAAIVAVRNDCEAAGVRSSLLPVDYASHSVHIEAIESELTAAVTAALTGAGDPDPHAEGTREQPSGPPVRVMSTVDVDWVTGELDAGYWVRNLRSQVRFAAAVERLAADGYRVFVEVSSHPVLTTSIQATLERAGIEDALVTGTLRRDEDEPARFLQSMGELWAGGGPVSAAALAALIPAAPVPGRPIPLPTYPFQRDRYWLPPNTHGRATAGLAGVSATGHPLLDAVVDVPGGVLLAGRLSIDAHPWLADHAIVDTVVIPGAGLVEFAITAGDRVDCPVLDELVIQAPLRIPATGAVDVQVHVTDADGTGRRPVTVSSRVTGTQGWQRNAEGFLTPTTSAADQIGTAMRGVWPPPGARPVPLEGFYERLADHGYSYGPSFHGLTAAWTREGEMFGEVTLPKGTETDVAGYGIHPALLDAALHLSMATTPAGDGGGVMIPFAWNRVALHATGATTLRIQATLGPGGLKIDLADTAGEPVLTFDALTSRPIMPSELTAPSTGGAEAMMLAVECTPLPGTALTTCDDGRTVATDRPGSAMIADRAALEALGQGRPEWLILDADPLTADTGAGELVRVRVVLARVLEVLQAFTTEPAYRGTRLAVIVRDAGCDPVAAAVAGLTRSAQSENPGQILLADLAQPNPGTDAAELVDFAGLFGRAAAADKWEIRVRDGRVEAPRLTRAEHVDSVVPAGDLAAGSVLVTGGTGTLGGLVARHLVAAHGVRSLVLASRQGPTAPGAPQLQAELEAAGAQVEIVACDVADRAQAEALLARVSGALSGVIHTAGVLDDTVLSGLTPERLETVLRPKADAATHLDELTRGLGLAAFVVFSSGAGVLGTPGQGNYAAANCYLDALATRRRASGEAAVSLAWGYWAQATSMTGSKTQADVARITRAGLGALETAQGMALLDAALDAGRPVLVPMVLDLAVLRRHDGPVPGALWAWPLARMLAGPQRRTAATSTVGALQATLAAMAPEEQVQHLAVLVRSEAAVILGAAGRNLVTTDSPLLDIGFDSLTAVELRNRLTTLTATRLPATLVFDHPTPSMIAVRLVELMRKEDAHA